MDVVIKKGIRVTQDLIGLTFGRLKVIQKLPSIIRKNGEKCGVWECECICGNIKVVKTNDLKIGKIKSCGCLKKDSKTLLPGQIFNRWTTIEYKGKSKWLCQCECGIQSLVAQDNLRSGKSKSCGCYKSETSAINILAAIDSIRQFEPKITSARDIWRTYLYKDKDSNSISFEDFYLISQLNCIYCNIKPSNNHNRFAMPSRTSSLAKQSMENGLFTYSGLDRINSKLKHTINNIVPCCIVCNRSKSNRTLTSYLEWVQQLFIRDFSPINIQVLLLPNNPILAEVKSLYRHEHHQDTDLTLEEFYALSQMNCFYCNLSPLHSNFYGSRFHYNGMDRISRDGTHSKNNIVPCCKWCNFAKGSLTLSDFQDWIRRIQTHIILPNTKLQLLIQQIKD